jgi:coproporphyrinogen III oxidase
VIEIGAAPRGDSRRAAVEIVGELQARICAAAENLETATAARAPQLAAQTFARDDWRRDGAPGPLGGWGSSRVLAGGAAFERGGVNVSVVTAPLLPPSVTAQRPELRDHAFFACGVSAVLHPRNPYAPTAHCNFRYFETQRPDGTPGSWWFGGGSDLTPYYPALEDVRHFHATLKAACDAHDPGFYAAFKAWCDRYFYLRHRAETRGVGGIFYDYLDASGFGEGERAPLARPKTWDELATFMRDAGLAFVAAYFPLVERHALAPFGERQRDFQLLRRGRYVEFNLLYDRGTTFGLQSGGRTESILMSLPPLARWAYDERAEPGSPEAQLGAYLVARDWFAADPFASGV